MSETTSVVPIDEPELNKCKTEMDGCKVDNFKTNDDVSHKSEDTEFKKKLEHFNRLTEITKFLNKQPKNIHIHVKNIIQSHEPHLINDSNSGINVNISELTQSTFQLIDDYITHVKHQNEILEAEPRT